MPLIATFSIVARDPANGDLGVAVASKFLGVGSIVSWARADAGALATQAYGNIMFGPRGLALMQVGASAEDALAALLADDELREERQVGIVDRYGNAAAHTGANCFNWAGHRLGAGFAIQGNILAGPQVVDAMAAAFTSTGGELAERLLAALAAGDAAGGDSRGRQSAALYVAREGGAYGGEYDRYVDLRVDDHPTPVDELARLLRLHRFYLTSPAEADLLPIDAATASELQTLLTNAGFYSGPVSGAWDDASWRALEAYGGVANLEMRLIARDRIDPQVLAYMRDTIGAGA